MNNSPEKITKAQRREVARAEKLAAEIARGRQRLMLKLAALGLAAVTTAGVGIAWTINHQTDSQTKPAITVPKPEFKSGVTVEPSKEQIAKTLDNEIARLGYKRSQKEFDLWFKSGINKKYPYLSIPKDSPIRQETQQRLTRALNLMDQSENPILKEAVTFLKRLKDDGELILAFTPNAGDVKDYMTTGPLVEDGKFFFYMNVADDALLSMDSLQIAITLCHEVKHLQNIYQRDLPYRQQTPEVRKAIQDRVRQNLSEQIAEEASGYAQQAEAYLEQARLINGRETGSQNELVAYFYVVTGSNPQSSDWKEIIKKEFMEMD